MDYFASALSAKRYSANRPYFHPIVAEIVRARLPDGFRFARGLDVACGTGLSTRMLADLATTVVGVDVSLAMLAEAFVAPNIHYEEAVAEQLPFPDSSFDVVTVGLGFHWFERSTFLKESRRVLEPAGMLVLYNHWFSGNMAGNPAFAGWHRETYLRRYPSPPRDVRPFRQEDASHAGFAGFEHVTFANDWLFSRDELARYLTSQSNVIAALESEREVPEQAYDWIISEIEPFWPLERETFQFEGAVTILRNAKEQA